MTEADPVDSVQRANDLHTRLSLASQTTRALMIGN